MSRAGGPRLAASWVTFALTAALAVSAVVLNADSTVASAVYEAVVYISIGGLGVAVTTRRPANAVGWLLQLIALALALNAFGYDVYTRGSAEAGPPGPVASLAAWCISWLWICAIVPAFTIFPLVFPTGRAPSRRWGVVLRLAVLAAVVTWFGTAFVPGPLEGAPDVQNPVGIDHSAVEVIGWVGFFALVPMTLASITSLVLRFRASEGRERQQLKWVALAATLLPVGFAAPGVSDEEAGFLLLLTAILLVAVAVAVAMLRHRLYDIDVVINRALVYGSLIALLVTTYVGGVLLLQLALRPVTQSSDLAVAGSTLAVAALFRPARDRIRGLVDRRFYRSRYDASRTLAAFTSGLRDHVDLEALSQQLLSVTSETVHPEHASLWLREG